MERTQDYDGRGPIADLFVLRPAEFNHVFRSGMSNVNLAKYCIAVVG